MAKKLPIQIKPDFTKDLIRTVESWPDSNYCALITRGGWIRLFNIAESRIVIDLFTHKDSGGVSVAMSSDGRHCFLGTYYAWGLACFDVSTGQMLWKRNDLRRFYGLTFSKAQNCLFCCFQGKSALRIDPKTGATLETFRGVNFISASPFSDAVLYGNQNQFTLRLGNGEKLWSAGRESFDVMDIAWSPGALAVSECVNCVKGDFGSAAGIRCFSLHGELLWRHRGRWTHIFSLMYRPESHQFIGFDPDRGKDIYLQYLNEQTGHLARELLMPHIMLGEFCQQGQKLLWVNYETNEFTLTSVS